MFFEGRCILAHTFESARLFEKIVETALKDKDVPSNLVRKLDELNSDVLVVKHDLDAGHYLGLYYENLDLDIQGWLGFNPDYKLILIFEFRPRPKKLVRWFFPTLKDDDANHWRTLPPS